MAKGITDGGSGQGSAGKDKQTSRDVLDSSADTFEADAEIADEEAEDVLITVVADLAADADLPLPSESETHKDHPLRQIEIRQEAKRLKALLREVYDEE